MEAANALLRSARDSIKYEPDSLYLGFLESGLMTAVFYRTACVHGSSGCEAAQE